MTGNFGLGASSNAQSNAKSIASASSLVRGGANSALEGLKETTGRSWGLHQLFEERASQSPDAVAVIFEGIGELGNWGIGELDAQLKTQNSKLRTLPNVLTYGELNARANQLAHYLQSLEVGPEVPVGICVERSPSMVVGLLGILKAGGAYVPLDPTYPQERIAYLLQHSQAPLLLSVERLLGSLPPTPTGARVVCLDTDRHKFPSNKENPTSGVTPDNLAYVVYTSGSTGKPKGVAISHASAANTIADVNSRFEVGSGDRVLAVSSLSFDLSVYDIFGLLAAGGTVVLPKTAKAPEPLLWAELVERHRITIWNSAPPLMQVLLAARPGRKQLASLRLVLLSGDWIPLEMPGRIKELAPEARVLSLGGATEASIWSILYEIESIDPCWRSIPYGRPMANQQFYVLSEDLEPLPVGVPGQLYIGGTGLARGYWRDEEKTNASFIVNSGTGERLYRTGDRGRYLNDGNIEFLGRIDNQVKIRGYRIELGEIESILRRHPSVREAVVVVREEASGNKRLAAYCVAEPSIQSPSASSTLRELLARELPEYMVPSIFLLQALPLTANGKIDRRALENQPIPLEQVWFQGEGNAGRTPEEKLLVEIWSEVLKIEKVGIHDNFFELGGDSILGIYILFKARQAGLEISARQLFEYQTIAELVRVATRQHARSQVALPAMSYPQETRRLGDKGSGERLSTLFPQLRASLPIPDAPVFGSDCLSPATEGYTPKDFPLSSQLSPLELEAVLEAVALVGDEAPNQPPKNIEDIYPLSPMQEGMLFHSLYAPKSGVYFQQLTWVVDGKFDPIAWQEAWQQVLERHAILRSAFVWGKAKEPLQIVLKAVRLPMQQLDWRHLGTLERQKQLETFLEADRRRGFELESAPLMRLALGRVAEDSYQFICSYHHALLDAWCWPLILKEVLAFYEASQLGKKLQIKPCRPYRDYIAWLQQQDLSEAEAFWRKELKGFTAPTPLGVDRISPKSSGKEKGYDRQQRRLSLETTTALKSFAISNKLTLNTLVQGAWALLLSRYSGETDIVFGVTVSGRPISLGGADEMIGLFINTLPLRVRVSPQDSLPKLLVGLQNKLIEVRSVENSSLARVQSWSEVPGGTPLFESIIVFENYPIDALQEATRGSIQTRDFRFLEMANYPIALVVSPDAELRLQIEYYEDRFDAGAIARILGHLQTILEAMADSYKGSRLVSLALLTEAERHQILVEWNDTKTDYPRAGVHELFEQQVERSPEEIAVIVGDRRLTYRELNCRANQLARYLQSLGVEPEVLVGICMERSVEMVVGLLGILKAGGAYLPLDPTYPKERLAYMLSDAKVSVLLTQEKLLERVPKQIARAVCLDAIARDAAIGQHALRPIATYSEKNLAVTVRPENLAYVIYTSGSTGKPKGACITHKGINRLVKNTNYISLDSSDVVAWVSNNSFDVAAWEIWGALVKGGRLVGWPTEITWVPKDLVQQLQEQQITVMFLTVGLFDRVASTIPDGFQSLRCLIVGGEAVDSKSAQRVLERGSPQKLLNGYGPTENATFSCCYEIARIPAGATNIPIGRPVANSFAYILDSFESPVPIGVRGELYVGGDGLARCYLNRPDLTAEKFIPNPFGEKGSRLYKTGDIARYLPDGNIEFLGRADNQVKVRGFRIELGEISAALQQHPEVRSCVVLNRSDGDGPALVAYWVPNFGREESVDSGELSNSSQTSHPSHTSLRRFLSEKLPQYMVPERFVLLSSLPLTPNGKIDRRALPKPSSARPIGEGNYRTPKTALEQTIALLWQEALQVDVVGLDDNFFDLGGNSLRMATVFYRLQEIEPDLKIVDLFTYPTISALAGYLAATIAPTQTVSASSERGLTSLARSRAQKQKESIKRKKKDR